MSLAPNFSSLIKGSKDQNRNSIPPSTDLDPADSDTPTSPSPVASPTSEGEGEITSPTSNSTNSTNNNPNNSTTTNSTSTNNPTSSSSISKTGSTPNRRSSRSSRRASTNLNNPASKRLSLNLNNNATNKIATGSPNKLKKSISSTNIVKFDKERTSSTISIQKVKVKDPSSSNKKSSLLTLSLTGGLHKKNTLKASSPRVKHIDLEDDPSIKKLTLTITIPTESNKKVAIQVPETFTAHQCIQRAIQVFNTEQAATQGDYLADDAELWVLRLIDDMTGGPDDDFPPLNKDRPIKKVNEFKFALTENPKFRGAARTRVARTASATTSSSTSGISSSSGITGASGASTPNSAATADPSSSSTSQGKQVFIKVWLPHGEYTLMSLAKVKTIGELLADIAKRRRLNPAEWLLVHKQTYIQYQVDATVDTLAQGDEVVFKPKNAAKFAAAESNKIPTATNNVPILGSAENPADYMYTEVSASKYEKYTLIKINTKGKRQDRVMGIDRDHIYNELPDGESTGILGQKAVKKPVRMIEDVIDAGLNSDSGPSFYIDFREQGEKDGHKVVNYEAKSRSTAAEIVAKVKYLTSLARRRSTELADLPKFKK